MAGPRNDNFKVDLRNASAISGGDELRNINCYEYLLYIFGRIPTDKKSDFGSIQNLQEFFKRYPFYHSGIPYGNLYTMFLGELEVELDSLSSDPQKYKEVVKRNADVIEAIYLNSNRALERTADMIATVTSSMMHTSSHAENAVRKRLTASTDAQVNEITPQYVGSLLGRAEAFINALRGDFKPQLLTSMASIRRYDHMVQFPELSTESRFGGQGEIHKGKARVNPLFEAWLSVFLDQTRRTPTVNPMSAASAAAAASATSSAASSASSLSADTMSASLRASVQPTSITSAQISQDEDMPSRQYLYINNLGLDRDSLEGGIEKEMTLALHALESKYPQLAVITLPADKGLLSFSQLNKHSKEMTYDQAFNRMLKVALGTSDEKVKDFYISEKTRKILFGANADIAKSRFESLLKSSFSKLGFNQGDKLSPAEFHAVYFHFIKYELTNDILTKLHPRAFNISCKDAIDRGGVSSAYYNLLKSIELGSPMSKEEFLRALHAAPALVKGRGINRHVKAIWNALNQYVEHAKVSLPAWLPLWVAENRLIGTRQDCIQKLEAYIDNRRKENTGSARLFSTYNAEEKISAATNLLLLLKGGRTDFTPTAKELGALNDGRLGVLVEEMRTYGILAPDQFKPDRDSHYHLGPAGF